MRAFLKVILLLLIPLVLIFAYSLSSVEITLGDWSLEKADLSALKGVLPDDVGRVPCDSTVESELASDFVIASADTVPDLEHAASDTAAARAQESASRPLHVVAPDSAAFRILFFGDSMLEGLARRMCDYTMENGYDLTSVIWYSSSTQLWAETDTLQYFLERIRPNYVVICLGSNELFVRDLTKRNNYIGNLVQKLADYPFIWISPPNWKEDTGINQLIIDHVGRGRYFDSRYLDLERASDHAHPTREAAAQWMDSVAVWMSSASCRYPLPMNLPTEQRPRKFHQYMLKPVR